VGIRATIQQNRICCQQYLLNHQAKAVGIGITPKGVFTIKISSQDIRGWELGDKIY
jgi:hypothetical protein